LFNDVVIRGRIPFETMVQVKQHLEGR